MPVFDKQKSRRSFDRAAHHYDQHARLQRKVAGRLLGHLHQHSAALSPQMILDIGCGTGQLTEAMCQDYKKANVVALDFSQQMLLQTERRLYESDASSLLVCGDAEQLPFQAASFDLIVSSLMLQWSNNLESTLRKIRELLMPSGVLAFTSFSEGTLKEVKTSWAAVDAAAHSSDFLSLNTFEATVNAAGYSKVLVIPETIVMQYDSIREILLDMKGIGASNARTERVKGLTGKARFEAFEQAFERFRLLDNSYPCTWEVTYVFCAK